MSFWLVVWNIFFTFPAEAPTRFSRLRPFLGLGLKSPGTAAGLPRLSEQRPETSETSPFRRPIGQA